MAVSVTKLKMLNNINHQYDHLQSIVKMTTEKICMLSLSHSMILMHHIQLLALQSSDKCTDLNGHNLQSILLRVFFFFSRLRRYEGNLQQEYC